MILKSIHLLVQIHPRTFRPIIERIRGVMKNIRQKVVLISISPASINIIQLII